MDDGQSEIKLLLYKQLTESELKKFVAQSNITPSGGGARDLRFGAYSSLLPAIKKMFPTQSKSTLPKTTGKLIYSGELFWRNNNDDIKTGVAHFTPPYPSRPSEGKISSVDRLGCFDRSLMPHQIDRLNSVLLLLIQLGDGSVWPHYASQKSLETPGKWHEDIAKILLRGLHSDKLGNRTLTGFKDFVTKDEYCNVR